MRLSRRSWVGVAVIVLAPSLPVGPAAAPATAAAAEPRPNILVILTDDQRVDTLDVMPKTKKWFQQRGTTFENGFVTTPLCCPSRATIFTGRYAHNHEVQTNADATALDQRTTVQRYLDDDGYRTAIAGKYLNSWKVKKDPPHFDRWAIMRAGYFDRKVNVDGKVSRNSSYSTTWARKKAIGFLEDFEKGDDRPWLLFVTPFAPHGPFTPEKKYRKASVPPWEPGPAVGEQDRSDKPQWVQDRGSTKKGARKVRKKQLRTLMSVDDLVGKILRRLGGLGERRRTLAFFLSDNGYLWAEHGLSGKRHPYTEAIQVPFMARWPRHVGAGGVDGRPVTNADIVPTILQAARVEPQALVAPVDGRSLLSDSDRERMLFEVWDAPSGPFVPTWASLRTSAIQYIEYYDKAGQVIFEEYYDLAADPWQLLNLLGDDDVANDPPATEVAQLSTLLVGDRRCQGTEGPFACP